jgi:xylan 1,4-beta-xylosidase
MPAFAAEQPEARVISADMNDVQGAFSSTPLLCVGAGRANEGLRADWQRQLAEVRNECGFRYLRFHGLLCDDMGVYFVDRQGREHYNWQYIDELFDYMLSIGVRPFVELGFMPSQMASGPSTIFWWRGNVTPPKDPAKWQALIKALLNHWVERYGEDEVAQWYFEVWNEPNLSGFWIGDRKGMNDAEFEVYARDEYFKLYAETVSAVKSVSSRFRVGGPATAGNGWITETIDFCAKNNLPLDFLSTHNYTVMAGYLDETGSAGTVFCQNRDAMIVDAERVRGQIEHSPLPGRELHYTEWSSSYTPSDPLHDSYHSAAFILSKLKGVGNTAQSMSYWTFTDIFEEAGPRYMPFHGGFGLLNYQGIRKPSFYAYQFVKKLGGTELRNKDAESWVTRDDKGGAQVLVWDFTITHPGESVINQSYYNQVLPSLPAAPVKVSLKNLAPGAYRLTASKVGFKSNDAYTAYIEMGAPAQLTKAQVAELKTVSDGSPFLVEMEDVGSAGSFERSFEMCQNDVILLTLEKR